MQTAELMEILATLAEERPLFHSEADFQHALAWAVQRRYPGAAVRLEYRSAHLPGRGYLDLWLRLDSTFVGLELKYKARGLATTIGDEPFDLLDQGAQDLGRYDFLKDLQRIETVQAKEPGCRGFALLLTNDSAYWKSALSPNSIDAAFRLHEGRIIRGELAWAAHAGGTIRGREQSLVIKGEYEARWRDYALVQGRAYSTFRYLLLPVGVA